MSDANTQVLSAILRRNLQAFVFQAFDREEVKDGLRPTQAIRLICETLQEVTEGDVRRQIINLPPRTLKSFICSICFPAWLLGLDPSTKIIVISHDKNLVHTLAYRCRQIIESKWYQEAFPGTALQPDFAGTLHFKTTAGGGVLATSVGSGLTGHGGDWIILDDPIDASDAYSGVERKNVNTLFDGKITSRLDNRSEGKILIVMQRLHAEDLCGHLQGRTTYRHLVVPLVAEADTVYRAGKFEWRRPAGDIIDPQSYTAEEVEVLRRESPAHVFQAQYQQAPILLDSGIVKADWFGRYDNVPLNAHKVIFSCDFGQTTGETSSYSCVLVIRTDGVNHYLAHVLRKRAAFAELQNDLLRLAGQYTPNSVLIENAALGTAMISALREHRLTICSIPRPTKSKIERLEAVLHLLNGGNVLLPNAGNWLSDFFEEMCSFPTSPHDDQVDALSQYLSWVEDPDRRRHSPVVLGVTTPQNGGVCSARKQVPHPMRNPKGPPRMPPLPQRR
ncbi:hypothetical protein FGKAn22_03870 [Ferrigenium kumadai]|uniref:Terminase large subunit gp17-like C-terminal domain-containing protein n=1 Tax=Ferrigenium kumadai TaxID=1682490 RepID=A0AAN1SZR7_9PROT|nr:phage terminase large subunit [Ferrigenium kumadai]BBI98694.1 hypothetical protein FGKAn22_03870 [Ferrigenium kumadai]